MQFEISASRALRITSRSVLPCLTSTVDTALRCVKVARRTSSGPLGLNLLTAGSTFLYTAYFRTFSGKAFITRLRSHCFVTEDGFDLTGFSAAAFRFSIRIGPAIYAASSTAREAIGTRQANLSRVFTLPAEEESVRFVSPRRMVCLCLKISLFCFAFHVRWLSISMQTASTAMRFLVCRVFVRQIQNISIKCRFAECVYLLERYSFRFAYEANYGTIDMEVASQASHLARDAFVSSMSVFLEVLVVAVRESKGHIQNLNRIRIHHPRQYSRILQDQWLRTLHTRARSVPNYSHLIGTMKTRPRYRSPRMCHKTTNLAMKAKMIMHR